MDHPRERFRTGWESAAHAVFVRGVPYLICLLGDRPEPARPVREFFAFARAPWHPIIVSYIFVRSILDTHEKSFHHVRIIVSFITCEALKFQTSNEKSNDATDFFVKKKKNDPFISVLFHRTVNAMVRINNRDSLAAESISPNAAGLLSLADNALNVLRLIEYLTISHALALR